MLNATDKTLFMPGPMSPGHHQIGLACGACHGDPLGGAEVLQEACVLCHQAERKKPFDSHPLDKFTDPRNADQLERIDARLCISCHIEHRPEITARDGLTQPLDLCAHCHADIAADRPSHEGMPFDSCKDSGCHNYHDNRALYTDFLLKHQQEPDLRERHRLPEKEFAALLDELVDYPRERYPIAALTGEQLDAPDRVVPEAVREDWLASRHAAAGVNCSACHLVAAAEDTPAEWTDHPGQEGCAQCHGLEQRRFAQGKHGMRLAAGLTPMTPAQARLPMQSDAAHAELNCNSCHPAHHFEVRQAAVESCLGCHADEHSLAYRDSVHYRLWQQEVRGELPTGSGVSCASCHMPRIRFDVSDWLSRIMVDHNQSANLSPNSKMIRSACLHCHGLSFSLDALADRALIETNFQGRPALHVRSIEMAEQDHRRALDEQAAAAAEE